MLLPFRNRSRPVRLYFDCNAFVMPVKIRLGIPRRYRDNFQSRC